MHGYKFLVFTMVVPVSDQDETLNGAAYTSALYGLRLSRSFDG